MTRCKRSSARIKICLSGAVLVAACALCAPALAADDRPVAVGPAGTSAAAEGAIVSLSFAEFFKRPVGARGLEPSARLLSSAGSTVRLTGFVAQPVSAHSAVAIMAAHRVALGDEDESLADDLPPAVAHLYWAEERIGARIVACRQAIRVTGRLELGARHEEDGRISFVRLRVDDAQCTG